MVEQLAKNDIGTIHRDLIIRQASHKIGNILLGWWIEQMVERACLTLNELTGLLNHTCYLRFITRTAETLNHNVVSASLLKHTHARRTRFIP